MVTELPGVVKVCAPPYEGERLLPPDAVKVRRGALLVVELQSRPLSARHREAIQALALKFSRPVFLRVSESKLAASPWTLTILSDTGAHAVVTEHHDLSTVAGEILAQPTDVGVHWAEWLAARRKLSRQVQSVIRLITSAAPEYRSVTNLLRDHDRSPRTARSRLRRHALPPPDHSIRQAGYCTVICGCNKTPA